MNNFSLILTFTKSIYPLLNSGLSIIQSLETAANVSPNISEVCNGIKLNLMEGMKFHEALDKCKSIKFPSLYKMFIKTGERSGNINKVLEKLIRYLETKKTQKQKIIQSLFYPILVCVMTVVLCFFVSFYIYPKFTLILQELNTADTKLTKTITSLSKNTKSLTALFAFFTSLTISLHVACKFSKSFKLFIDKLFLCIPLFGNYIKVSCTKDFAFIMELLLSSGMQIVESLEEAKSAVSNTFYAYEIFELQQNIMQGMNINDAASCLKSFPPHVVTYLMIGERTGNLRNSFNQLCIYYEKQNEHQTQNFMIVMEPLFILISGIVLIFFVINFILPIFSVLGGI